jgi:5-methylcytosine-specific restriction endonuclease McrA
MTRRVRIPLSSFPRKRESSFFFRSLRFHQFFSGGDIAESMGSKPAASENPIYAARHCLDEMPYRMIVFERMNQRTPLYRVAGSSRQALKARNALREAFAIHGGACFYCKIKVAPEHFSIDHVETTDAGDGLQNLVVTHKACNLDKGRQRIEAYNPDAGREWLEALLRQVQDRLNRL